MAGMEISVCYHQGTKQVAFAECPQEFVDVIQDIMGLPLRDILQLIKEEDGEQVQGPRQGQGQGQPPLCNWLKPREPTLGRSLSQATCAVLGLPPPTAAKAEPTEASSGASPARPGAPELVAAVPSPTLATCKKSSVVLFPKSCPKCPVCFARGSTSPCTPAAVEFIPSAPGQKDLDPLRLMYRCSNANCNTYSNRPYIHCSKCGAGAAVLDCCFMDCRGLSGTSTPLGAAPAPSQPYRSGQAPQQPSPFGGAANPLGSASPSPLGTARPAAGGLSGSSGTPFGQTSAPAVGQTSLPPFGQTSAPAFGAAFQSLLYSIPVAGTPFGGTAFGQAPAPAFGQTSLPAFGQPPTQAPAPAFGQASSTPGLGQTSTPSAFGRIPAPAFGTSTNPGSLFGHRTATPFPAIPGGGGERKGDGAARQGNRAASLSAPGVAGKRPCCLITDGLEVITDFLQTTTIELLKNKGMFNLEDIETIRVPIKRREVLELIKAGVVSGSESVLTDLLASHL